MRRLFINKWSILITITVVMLVIAGVTFKSNSVVNRITNIVSVPLAPVQRLFSAAGVKIQDGIGFFRDIGATKQENIVLKEQIDKLEQENRELKEYREENKELRQALNIKSQFADYESMGANIIAKDLGNWFNIFTVDRGVKDGIEKNSPVITSKGLVGRVTQVDAISSKVESIIDKNSVLYARISQKDDLVRVKGDIQLKDQGLCLMDRISADVEIAVGDDVVTSGIGGIYPRGILIGKVKEIRKSSDELSRYAIIQPAVDFKRLDEVIILKGKNEDIGSEQK